MRAYYKLGDGYFFCDTGAGDRITIQYRTDFVTIKISKPTEPLQYGYYKLQAISEIEFSRALDDADQVIKNIGKKYKTIPK